MKKYAALFIALALACVNAHIGAIDYDYMESEPVEEIYLTDESDEMLDNSIIFRIGSPRALVNGKIEYIDEGNKYLAPFIDEANRTLVPVRFIAESLGFGVEADFNEDYKKITIFGDTRLSMYIGSNVIEMESQIIIMDTVPKISKDRTFIPARHFAESLGLKVFYAESERIIIITDCDIEDAEKVAAQASDKLPVWPLDMPKVLAEWKNWPENPDGSYHAGADFSIPEGSDVYSAYSGIVDMSVDEGYSSYGAYIVIKSIIGGKERYMYYAHLSGRSVEEGDKVRAGDIIGKTGNTGLSTGPHLHYEARDENKNHGSPDNPALNPYDYLP